MNNTESPQHNNAEEVEKYEVAENRHEAFKKITFVFEKLLTSRFGENGTIEQMPFHNLAHSRDVAEKATNMLKIIRGIDATLVSEEDIELAYMIGLGHDLVQNADKKDGATRVRHRGFKEYNKEKLKELGVLIGNEEATGKEILEETHRYRGPDGELLFPSDKFKERIMEAVGVTYTDVLPNTELPQDAMHVKTAKTKGKTVKDEYLPHEFLKALKFYQPVLTPESSLVSFSIAQADLRGVCGAAENPAIFQNRGDVEFHELQSEAIVKEVQKGIKHIPQERRVEIAKIILGWIKSQVGFALWQRELFNEELEKNNVIHNSKKAEEIKIALHKMFGHFGENILGAYARYERLMYEFGEKIDDGQINNESFNKLLKEMNLI